MPLRPALRAAIVVSGLAVGCAGAATQREEPTTPSGDDSSTTPRATETPSDAVAAAPADAVADATTDTTDATTDTTDATTDTETETDTEALSDAFAEALSGEPEPTPAQRCRQQGGQWQREIERCFIVPVTVGPFVPPAMNG